MWTALFLFARKNWQVIAIGVIIGLVYFRITAIVDERDEAKKSLKQTTELIRDNERKRQAELEISRKQGKQNVATIEAKHLQDIQHIANQYTKGWNHDNQTNRSVIASLRGELDSRLRNQSAANDSARVSEDDANRIARTNGNTSFTGSSENQADFYRAAYRGAQEYIETLESAGAMCAADYNLCKSYVDSEQARLGVDLPSDGR